jgi:putative peptidoglycan lipid II flippase
LEQKTSEVYSRKNAADYIIKKSRVITAIILIGKFLGFVREAVQAYLFGAGGLVGAFIVAYNFPELIQTLFFSGATSAFLIPVCTRYLGNEKEYSKVYSTFFNISIVVTILVSFLFFLFSDTMTYVMAPGFNPETRKMTRMLFVIMIPLIVFETLLSIMKAFLNAKEHFAAPEMSGVLWNLFTIACALLLSKQLGIYSLAIGVTAGTFLQVVMQYPYLRHYNIRYSIAMDLHHPALTEAKTLFLGALIAASIVPINSFIGRSIATCLPNGAEVVAFLSYAFRIFLFPAGLFVVPVYTVVFSKISMLYHEKNWKGLYAHLDSSIGLLVIILIPSTILLCSVGDLCIGILYQRGAFTAYDTMMTNKALFGYSIGLVFYALSAIFVRVFNAMHDVKTPAFIGVTSIGLNALLVMLLMVPFKGMGVALATSVVSCYNFIMLYVILKKRIHYSIAKRTIRDIIKSLLAGIILVLLIYLTKYLCRGSLYLPLFVSTFLAIAIYGIFFRGYYSMFLKKK